MNRPNKTNGKVSWRCPSNIALVKYWGKHGEQLPNNPSLSITLQNAFSETSVTYSFDELQNDVLTTFSFGKTRNEAFEARVNKFLNKIQPQMPFLKNLKLNIESKNNFPHSAGIASSASSFGSLALCICSIEQQLFGQLSGYLEFKEKASYLARIGSGSACRSMYDGFVVWGKHPSIDSSSEIYSVPVNHAIHPVFQKMQDSILIVSSEKKKVSSSEGHALMEKNPYAPIRYQNANQSLQQLMVALGKGDMQQFIKITESEALELHALMMLSEASYILFRPNSLAIIEKVRKLRAETGLPVCFTLDAGPNVHLLYPESAKEEVQNFIREELLQHCEHNQWIHDRIGQGPVQLINE
jgi:diphosphomevalonate decarboxylase